MPIESYQNLVIGSGAGGKIAAWSLAKQGQKTVVVERSMIGGSCPNVACLPSKNEIYSAKAISLVSRKTGLGVTKGEVTVDMQGVVCRKRQMVEGLIQMHLDNFRATGAELVMGHARFIAPKTVEVKLNDGGTRQLHGQQVILAVGTRASIPDVPGLVAAKPLTHVEALNLGRLPEHLLVLGGGYVGLEFAQALRRFGSRVTIVQRGPRLLEREDPDVAEAIAQLMLDEGIEVLLDTQLASVSGQSGDGVTVQLKTGGNERTLEATDILVAAGRTPNTDQLDLAKTGVELDPRGYIRVNERLQTTASDIWAAGDCAGSPQFTHVGEDDARVIVSNLTGGHRTTNSRLIPYCLFTDPELAHVGLNETAARSQSVDYRLIKVPMKSVLRTRTLSDTRGFAKALIAADDRILGLTVFGAEASEMMAVVQTAMIAGMSYTALREIIFAHPTTAEGLNGMLANAPTAVAAK